MTISDIEKLEQWFDKFAHDPDVPHGLDISYPLAKLKDMKREMLSAECAVPEGMVLVPRKLLDAAQDVREEFGDPQYHSYVTDKQIALCDLLRDYGDDAECERNKEK